MSNIERIVDGDTFTTDEGKVRIGYIDTPESKHPDETRNTEEGKIAEQFAKHLIPEGTDVELSTYGEDVFGRDLSGMTRDINGVKIDYGLVALDQGMSNYYIKYGKHPNPKTHEQYKEYFSKHAPYQYGTSEEPLSREQMSIMQQKHKAFTDTYAEFKKGAKTQEDLDKVTADLYGDPELVVRYRSTLNNWDAPIEYEDMYSLRGAMKLAIQDPVLKEQYNRAVRNHHLRDTAVPPEEDKTFWENKDVTFSLLGSVSQFTDFNRLYTSRHYGTDDDTISDTELTKGLPQQFHQVVLAEAEKYNTTAALTFRNQLIEDIANNKIFDNMEWYAQLGYGALALLADPLTVIPAAPIAKGGQAINAGVKLWTANKAVQNAALMATWAGAGATEGAIVNAPRLAADHTYTSKDYMLDTIFDAGFGLGLGGVAEYAAKPMFKRYVTDVRASRLREQEEIQNYVEKRDLPKEPATPELQEVKEELTTFKAESTAKARISAVTGTKFTPWEAITEVSKEGFSLASRTLIETFPRDTPMRKLINSQLGLNKKQLSKEERVVANQLNADILHLVSAFPDGRVPTNVGKSIEAITFRQKTFKRNNAMQDVLQGNVSNPTATLRGYLQALRNHTELWEGYDPMPISKEEFFAQQSDWLIYGKSNVDEDITSLSAQIPKDISYLKDVVELNKMAAKRDDTEFTELVEELNGLVATRMEQREYGELPRYSDATKSFGKTVEMSPQEISAQLRKEGLEPRTSAYSKRLKELRKTGRVAVSDEVRKIGRVDEFTVGREVVEADLDGQDYYLTTDAKRELLALQKKPNPTKEDVARAKILTKEIDRAKKPTTTELIKDTFEQDLLPRSYIEVESQAAYKNTSLKTLTELKNRLDKDILKKLGVKVIRGKAEHKAQQVRLERVKSALTKDKAKVLDRLVKAKQWQNIEDVIRASHTLAEEAKVRPVEGKPVQTPLTEEDVAIVLDGNTGNTEPQVPKEVHDELIKKVEDSANKTVQQSAEKIAKGLTDFVSTGEKRAFELARKPRGILDSVGRVAAKMTEDLGTKLQNSKLTSLEYVGSRITEIGKGYGGAIRRPATGGLIRDHTFKESMMQIAPQYVNAIDKYAVSKGRSAVGRLNAQQMAGADNQLVKQFNRDVFLVQEYRRQGRQLPAKLDKSVIDFVDAWDKYMDYNHNQLVTTGIKGFTKERKIKHYIPHVWKSGNLETAVRDYGEDKVVELFARAYQSSINNGINPIDVAKARELAKEHIDWIMQQGKDQTDQFLPAIDSRAKRRLDLDTTMEMDGMSIMDFLDDEVISLATKYSNRMAGWVGLSKSTDGMLTSQLDIDSLKNNMVQEGIDKGISTKKYEQYYDDLMDLMFGRPTRGGLNQELRQLKDLTALTRMGGLGTAQLIETGQVITRSVLSTFSSEPVVKKVMKMGGKVGDEDGLIREIQSISNITDDLEWLDRQSVHLDQAELAKVNKARQLSLWLADTATFGAYKAPASRLLGKTTGYNAIRRAQSRIAQASFTVDVAKHFKNGSGVMGNARMADLGLTDTSGNNQALKEAFTKFVEYGDDGLPKKLNFDKWSTEARESFQYALVRDEAQQIQRTHVGELPPWMNKPMMALIFQFRQMPIVATNKQLGRALAFADKEAVTATMLNAAMAGLVRYSKFAALGLGVKAITDREWQDPNQEQMQVDKYIAQFGIFPDTKDLVIDAYTAGTTGTPEDVTKLMGQVPAMGLMKDYWDLGEGLYNRDINEQIDAAQGLVPLGNTAYGDMLHTWLQETFGE